MTKLALFLFALLLESFSLSSQAADYYVGVEASPYVTWKDCVLYVECSADISTNRKSNGVGIRIGYWLSPGDNARTGIEIGYNKFSSYSGSDVWYPNGCPSFLYCNPPAATATWKTDGQLIYADWIGKMPIRNLSWLVKGGIFASSVTTEGNYGLGGGTYERKVSGVGVVVGTGFLFPLSEHFSARAALDWFINVKVASPFSTTNTNSDTLMNFSLGVDYSL